MKIEDIAKENSKIACFFCGSVLANFPNEKFIAICDNENVLVIKNARTDKADPMVFCSSDCMVYDCHLRYEDRVARGTFRKKFHADYNDHNRLPKSFQTDDRDLLIKGGEKN